LAGTTTLAIVVTAAAVATALALLLAIVIRDIPDTSSAAADLVTEIAVAFDVPADEADALAARVVTQVDDTLLGGTISTAAEIRFMVRLLPVLPILLILVSVALSGRGRRLRWLGWAAMVTGLTLVACTWLLQHAGDDTAGLSGDAEVVAVRYVSGRVGPGWVIGLTCTVIGLALFLLGRRAPEAPTSS
jgi:hypothetical protein